MKETILEELIKKVEKELDICENLKDLSALRNKYLGKNSQLINSLQQLRNLSVEERKIQGSKINKYRIILEKIFFEKKEILENEILEQELNSEKIDITLPVNNFRIANYHPLNLVISEITTIFQSLGYQIVFGTEIDSDEYNFTKLNLEKGHPARDMQDSFYLDSDYLLRTHCTNVTAHMLSEYKDLTKPLAVISLGNVYRRDDDDATHSHQFMQVDGFLVFKDINFANLKWTLNYLIKKIFNDNSKMRLRPSYFPFTEPSVEVDVSCSKCQLIGCYLCKYTGWIEVLGAGMISPNVFIKNNLSSKLQGFAFGIGIERIAMLKYGIDDIRLFYNNDYRFLKQFNNF